MGNSGLVDCTRLSPNHSGVRNHAIDTITPHCVVGQATAERIADCFPPAVYDSKGKLISGRKASCNYGIGYDGRKSLIVEEKFCSWCTSNRANDQRAITIECASETAHPYAMTDAVYAALIDLCTDICRRYDKKKLLWFADKAKTLSYAPKADEMLITVHRWFAAKECPGDWLYNRLGDLAAKVTARLDGVAAETETPKQEAVNTQGNDAAEKTIWNKLKSYGLNDFAVAGVMGNFCAESGFAANNLQNSFNERLKMTDAEYTAAVDNGSYTNFVRDSAGYGLAQWTYWSRKQALLEFARQRGKSIGDLDMQLEFFWKEVQGYKAVLDVLKNAASILDASNAMLHGYEKPADQSAGSEKKRAAYGQGIYDKYANATPTPTPIPTPQAPAKFPYQVRVKIPDLYIRKGAGVNYQKGNFTGKGVFTIVEEAEGQISGNGKIGKWGLLKSYQKNRDGWICLSLGDAVTEKV